MKSSWFELAETRVYLGDGSGKGGVGGGGGGGGKLIS